MSTTTCRIELVIEGTQSFRNRFFVTGVLKSITNDLLSGRGDVAQIGCVGFVKRNSALTSASSERDIR